MTELSNNNIHYTHLEAMLFDTCTHKCAYCYFAESGKVLDVSQLRPYRDPAFIDQIVAFIQQRTTANSKWFVSMTGGEPLLMPNFDRLVRGISQGGNKVAFYTALLAGENHPSLRFLLDEGADFTDYLMCSFHPEAESIEDEFFARLKLLKQSGHNVIFRFVAHPDRIDRLDYLADRCRSIDIAFHPTPLFSPIYPRAYTDAQRAAIEAHVSTLSQLIQLENGLDTRFTNCTAGSEIFMADFRTGNITPCASLGGGPILGNIFDNVLKPYPGPIRCPRAGISCVCDTHFQQNIVRGAEDRDYFELEKNGFKEPVSIDELKNLILSSGLSFSEQPAGIGQTETADFLALDTDTVKSSYAAIQPFIESGAQIHHPEFLTRQFPKI